MRSTSSRPSMPGYASGPRAHAGHGCREDRRRWADLARARHARFGAGGDWGPIPTYLGANHADVVAGIHLNMVIAFPPDPANPLDGLNQDEVIDMMPMQTFLQEETGYQRIQGTKPQTLGYGLNDSPAGLAAWIVEKFRAWSDCDGDVEKRSRRTSPDEHHASGPETVTAGAALLRDAHAGSSRRNSCERRRAARSSRGRSRKPPRAWVDRLTTSRTGRASRPAATSRRWRARASAGCPQTFRLIR